MNSTEKNIKKARFKYIRLEIKNLLIGILVYALYDRLVHHIPLHEYDVLSDLGSLLVYSTTITVAHYIRDKKEE